MNILAFDFGTKTGWAASCNNAIESGVQVFDLARGESPGMRFFRFNNWLVEMLKTARPGVVIYEQAHHRGGYATDLLVGMTTRLQEQCARLGIEYKPVHTAALKKTACGSGRADKSKMIEAARLRFPGRTISNDDEADALLLLNYAFKEFSGREEIT